MILIPPKGRLDLERPANDYLKAARPASRVGHSPADATIPSLLQHTSGLVS